MAVFTRSRAQEVDNDEVPPMGPLEFQAERWSRIKVHQEEDEYLAEIRAFLNDDLDRFSSTRLKKICSFWMIEEYCIDFHTLFAEDHKTPWII
ncbi:hypothetical protein PHMEG_00017181 [Phytophthora megakarya]|uniref:Uncharacterized protein n=1 Tax=Phytophthora megakarya TaxID=4795 RepID=A0A225VXF8_9STRA|nr:hypothetical protein PHMEG_00017181 [Phytophthora megakarya]